MSEYDAILKWIRSEMNSISDTILTTRLDIEEYRRLQGVIEGLALTERHILDLKKTEEEDE